MKQSLQFICKPYTIDFERRGTQISTALNPSKRAQINALECSKLIRVLVMINAFLTNKYVHISNK